MQGSLFFKAFFKLSFQKITIEEFLLLAGKHLVLDVRSPGEYKHAHIPGAQSFPLFTDEERKLVGTAYKQQSREQAIKIGLDFFGVKMKKIVEETELLLGNHKPAVNTTDPKQSASSSRTILVHCWRGGMRSAAIAWLLDLYGFKVYTLAGGYKVFRRWVLDQFEKDYPFSVVGGYTGSGKTYVLHELAKKKEAVIDFEGIAGHKGSAFGNIGMPAQPGQEQFENILAVKLYAAALTQQPIWVEDESQRIGTVNLPINLWKNMRTKPLYFLEIPFEERLQHITKEYGKLDREKLVNAIIRIKKRLGGLETKECIHALLEERTADCFRILLTYYDKWYLKGMHNRDQFETLLHKIPCETVSPKNISQLLQSN